MSREWEPNQELSPAEETLLKLCKKQPFWSFLRRHRHLLLDDQVQEWLHQMYATKSRGTPRVAPERLLLAMLLQVAFQVPDHEVPTLTAVDRRWQMILDLEPSDAPAFSQGTVFHFRERLREHGLLEKLLEKTVTLARETGGFSERRLRALIDSSPLLGAGRVEDTFNLLGRALRDLLECSAQTSGLAPEELIEAAGLLPLRSASIKAVLDVDWTHPQARTLALQGLVEQFQRLHQWLTQTLEEDQLQREPLHPKIEQVRRLLEQDTEPDPDPPDGSDPSLHRRIKQGGNERVISLSDQDMRHGRKSKTKGFAGYKRHVAVDAQIPGLILGVHVEPANRPEAEGAAPLLERLEGQDWEVVELHVDRGYLSSPAIRGRRLAGMNLVSKPHQRARKTKYYSKEKFEIDFENKQVVCPNGEVTELRRSRSGKRVGSYSVRVCRECPMREHCTPESRGRKLEFHEDEEFHREMAAELKTPEGRAQRRLRTPVEHALGRVGAIQGRRARFRGRVKNQFDLERTALVANLFVLRRLAS